MTEKTKDNDVEYDLPISPCNLLNQVSKAKLPEISHKELQDEK